MYNYYDFQCGMVICFPLADFTVFNIDEAIYVPLLRQQQIRLGLLKAARVLFSQQENLRQIMARPASSEGDQYSLFQQLLSAATRPSPIKAMFSRDELEVGLYSNFSDVSKCNGLLSSLESFYVRTRLNMSLFVYCFLFTLSGCCCVSVPVPCFRGAQTHPSCSIT